MNSLRSLDEISSLLLGHLGLGLLRWLEWDSGHLCSCVKQLVDKISTITCHEWRGIYQSFQEGNPCHLVPGDVLRIPFGGGGLEST